MGLRRDYRAWFHRTIGSCPILRYLALSRLGHHHSPERAPYFSVGQRPSDLGGRNIGFGRSQHWIWGGRNIGFGLLRYWILATISSHFVIRSSPSPSVPRSPEPPACMSRNPFLHPFSGKVFGNHHIHPELLFPDFPVRHCYKSKPIFLP